MIPDNEVDTNPANEPGPSGHQINGQQTRDRQMVGRQGQGPRKTRLKWPERQLKPRSGRPAPLAPVQLLLNRAIRHRRLAMNAARGVSRAQDEAGRNAASARVCKHLIALLNPDTNRARGVQDGWALARGVAAWQDTPAQAWVRCEPESLAARNGVGACAERWSPDPQLALPNCAETVPRRRERISVHEQTPVQVSLPLF